MYGNPIYKMELAKILSKSEWVISLNWCMFVPRMRECGGSFWRGRLMVVEYPESCLRLFVTQGNYGIDAGGAARGQIAGEQTCRDQSEWGEDKGPRIKGRDAPELGLQDADGKERNQKA